MSPGFLPVSNLHFSPELVSGALRGLQVLDANVGIGSRSVSYQGDLCSASEILSALDRYGIEQAVVFHYVATENHPLVGNELLMRELAHRDRLLPQWVLLPESTGEFPAVMELANLLAEQKIHSVRMAPQSHGYAFTSWCCGSLFEMLAERRLPLFLSVDQIDWEDLSRVLSEFPSFRVVLTDTGYRIGRKVYPLLRRFDNLFMEYSSYVIHWGLEDLCAQIGPGRFVFGSGLGREEAGVPLTVLALADLPRKSKQLLAGENLARLLNLDARLV